MAETAPSTWFDIAIAALRRNEVKLITFVPDRVLTPLIAGLQADPYFEVIGATREEEAVGIVSGAWMGGVRGAVLMQTSGFATLPNVLASLIVACQIPAIMMISERGTLGDHQLGQAIVCRTMVPLLQTLGIEHHRIARLDECEFIVDRALKQAFATQAPTALILSPLLTNNPAYQ